MIGKRLALIRKDHGQTQNDLAKRLRVSLATVRAWEQGKSSPSHETLVEICRMYQISSDFLLGLSDDDLQYFQRRSHALFTQEELSQIRTFGSYLLWKRNRKNL